MNRLVVERKSVVRKSRTDEPFRFALGLDLGQARDYSAIVVVERVTPVNLGEGDLCRRLQSPEYHVRYVERFPLGAPYPQIVDEVEALLAERSLAGRTRLVIDGTGVGAPVVDQFQRRGAPLLPVVITGGDAISYKGRTVRVPKRDLVSVLQVLFQNKRLKIAVDIAERDVLLQELMNFSAKITTSAHDTYEAWREGDHDDLVLALAFACWAFERHSPSAGVNLRVTGLPRR